MPHSRVQEFNWSHPLTRDVSLPKKPMHMNSNAMRGGLTPQLSGQGGESHFLWRAVEAVIIHFTVEKINILAWWWCTWNSVPFHHQTLTNSVDMIPVHQYSCLQPSTPPPDYVKCFLEALTLKLSRQTIACFSHSHRIQFQRQLQQSRFCSWDWTRCWTCTKPWRYVHSVMRRVWGMEGGGCGGRWDVAQQKVPQAGGVVAVEKGGGGLCGS